MKQFFAILALLFYVTACQTPDNGENPSEELVEKSMEQLIEDLQNGLFIAGYYEVYDGDVCIKKSDEYIGDSMGAKFGDMGLDHRMAFYNDGTCRYGYSNSFVGGCSKKDSSHPKRLYDTWYWSYDIDAKTITITAPDLSEKEGTFIIGDECHIISSSADGPRYRPGLGDYDSYDNLILLIAAD